MRNSDSHRLHGLLNELHPCVPLLFGAGIHLYHLRLLNAGRDQEQTFLLIGYFPQDEFLQRDDGGALVLRVENKKMSITQH